MSRFKKIAEGIFVGPQPTPQDLDEARLQGIKTAIDLRMPAETTSANRGH